MNRFSTCIKLERSFWLGRVDDVAENQVRNHDYMLICNRHLVLVRREISHTQA